MPGIVIPSDRTTQQPARGYCLNPACRENSNDTRYEFDVDHDRFACPKCGQNQPPGVGLLTLTHLLIMDPRGPIVGQSFRFRLACNSKRAYLATATNLEAATAIPDVANCPGCLAEAARLGIHTIQGHALIPKPSHGG